MDSGFSGSVHSRYQEAHAQIKGQRPHLALEILREISTREPSFAPAQNDLGLLYHEAGNPAAALFHLLKAWELTSHPIALENYVTVLRSAGQSEEALHLLLNVEEEGKLVASGYAHLAGCLYDTKKLIELGRVLEKWIELAPEDPAPRLRLLELPAMLTQVLKGELKDHRAEIEELVSSVSLCYNEIQKGPFITVGIPTRNRTDPLYVMLSSLARQSYRHFEVLVSDDSTQLGLEYEVRRIFPDLNIRYIRGPQKNLPANRACIMEHAQGELVVMCDDDHYMVPDCLEILVDSMLQNPRAGIVSAVWPHPFENPQIIDLEKVKEVDEYRLDISDVGSPDNFWWKHACELSKSYIKDWPLLKSELSGGGCLIYRKSAVLSVGGFPKDCSFVSFREDTDISHRLYLSGYDIFVQTAALAFHLRATDGGCRDEQEWGEKLVRDGVRFLDKLKAWRRAKEEREVLSKSGRLKVGIFSESVKGIWQELIKATRGIELAGDKNLCAFEICLPGERMDFANRVLVEINSANEKLAIEELNNRQAFAAITTDEKLFYRHCLEENWFFLPREVCNMSTNWVFEREQVTSKNQPTSESLGLSLEVVFREIERIIFFGPKKYTWTPEEKILSLVEENFSPNPKRPYTSFIKSQSDRNFWLADDFIPEQLKDFEEFQKRLKGFPTFLFHYGGAGDALLLLANAIDNIKPEPGTLTILSAATSLESSRAFFREFPEVGDLYLVQLPDDPVRLMMLRYSAATTGSCRGLGATPLRSHKEDWVPGLDITKSYGIPLYPEWVKSFPAKILADKQIAVAPRGSGLHMAGGKSNSIPQVMWEDIIFLIKSAGFTPVILGTPTEEAEYPTPAGCITRRSYNFREQMEIIKGSVALVGADSWAKTFSALAGKPTLVFPPTYDGVFSTSEDASGNVFLKPWQNITMCKSTQDLERFLSFK